LARSAALRELWFVENFGEWETRWLSQLYPKRSGSVPN
jgi:hypothetical protein